ncbi:MAG: 3-keto-disaccharide hydrolase [Planctomycetota bacterium]
MPHRYSTARFFALLTAGGTRGRIATVGFLAIALLAALGVCAETEWTSGTVWPEPKIVAPGATAADPPSDAIVLFDGTDLSQWEHGDKWVIKNGYAIARSTDVTTKQAFGDCQLHLEWASPEKVEGSGQGRGNSGVYFMGAYEVQILDSYDNPTYYDGQCGSIYKQNPPLVNASRKPGEWQSYDILFTAPRFGESGELLSPAYLTVIHNGVLVQNHFELKGGTFWHKPPSYTAHAEKLPLLLQFHRDPVKFRNIWIREL